MAGESFGVGGLGFRGCIAGDRPTNPHQADFGFRVWLEGVRVSCFVLGFRVSVSGGWSLVFRLEDFVVRGPGSGFRFSGFGVWLMKRS